MKKKIEMAPTKNLDLPKSVMRLLTIELASSEFNSLKPFMEFLLIEHTEKKENQPPTSESVYRTIIESLTHVIWVATKEGEITYLNQAWENWTGREINDSLGHNWVGSLHPEDLQPQLEKWENAYKNGKRYHGECRFVHINGNITHCAYVGVPVKDPSGEVTNWIGIDFDITERKNGELELKNKVAELTRLNKVLEKRDNELKEVKSILEKLEKHQINSN